MPSFAQSLRQTQILASLWMVSSLRLVKFFVFLDHEQNLAFFKGLILISSGSAESFYVPQYAIGAKNEKKP